MAFMVQSAMFVVQTPSWLMILAVLVIVMIALAVARRRKRDEQRWDVKICPACGANNPPHAGHCRACGVRVKG